MKKLLLLLLCFSVLAVFGKNDPLQNDPRIFKLPKGLSPKDYIPNTLIVKFKKGISASQIRAATSVLKSNSLKLKSASIRDVKQVFKTSLQASSVQPLSSLPPKDTIGLDRIYEFNYSSARSIESVINEVLKNSLIEYAEPSYIYYTTYIPNDPLYTSSQTHLKQVKAEQAWDLIRSLNNGVINTRNIVIAIVDSGSDMDHIDLKSNLILPGIDLVGRSFSTEQIDFDPDVKSDSADHGVKVSGLASAITDNGLGIASLASNARLLIVKAAADDKGSAIYRGYEGIKYAADNGANIINCSWGGTGGGAFGQDIVNYALARGCLIIAAAGNHNQAAQDFPASYNGVMAIASVDKNDLKSSFSNFGDYVDLSAPGEIFSTANGNKYGTVQGTSFSAPLVSSAAALVWSRFPQFDWEQVMEQLRVTADNIDALNQGYSGKLGKGRLNVFRALTEAFPSVRYQQVTVQDNSNDSRSPGDTIRIFLDLKNFLAPASGLIVKLSSVNPNVQIIDQQVNAGNIGMKELRSMVGPFRVYIKPGTPDNQVVSFKLNYSANGTYNDSESFEIATALDYKNIRVNQVSTTMTSNGRIGYRNGEALNGIGFNYKGESLLYEASLLIGSSVSAVSNNTRNDASTYDEHFVKKVKVYKDTDPKAAFVGKSEFDDSGNPDPLKIYIKHKLTAFKDNPDDKYIIAEYEIQNRAESVLNDVYAGLFTDWEIAPGTSNVTKYDAAGKLAYAFGKFGTGPYAGVKLLNHTAGPVYYPLSYMVQGDPTQTGGGVTIAEKYQVLSSGIKAESLGDNVPNGYDIMFVSGYGPFTIPVNGSIKVAFALIAGDNLSDIQASAAAAQNKYDEINRTEANVSADGFVLKQNYPNPSPDRTKIGFSVSRTGYTSLILYNSAGKAVKELFKGSLPQGSYTIDADLSELESGIYLYRMLYDGKEKTLKLILAK